MDVDIQPSSSRRGEEQVPTQWNASAVGHAIVLERDRLTIRYTGEGRNGNDVGGVQANRPVPRKRLIYYYEVTVINHGVKGTIAIGFADKNFRLTKQPGWEPGSYGYHGDDGKKFHNQGHGDDYGPRFGAGDVVGAGIHLNNQEIFFTKNGVKLKTAFRNVKGVLYPTVGLHSKNEEVRVNFGAEPFVFDLQGLINEEHASVKVNLDKLEIPAHASLQLVADYLRDAAYGETLRALQQEALMNLGPEQTPALSLLGLTGAAPPAHAHSDSNGNDDSGLMSVDAQDVTWLGLRQHVRRSIMSGDIDAAMDAIRRACPEMMCSGGGYEELQFQLHTQKFIELVRAGQVVEALGWAHSSLSPLHPQLPQLDGQLKEVVALLAYTHPENSPLSHLLADSHRLAVAESVNGALLTAAAGGPQVVSKTPQPGLLRVLQQLVQVHEQLLDLNGGQGEPFDLSTYLPPCHS